MLSGLITEEEEACDSKEGAAAPRCRSGTGLLGSVANILVMLGVGSLVVAAEAEKLLLLLLLVLEGPNKEESEEPGLSNISPGSGLILTFAASSLISKSLTSDKLAGEEVMGSKRVAMSVVPNPPKGLLSGPSMSKIERLGWAEGGGGCWGGCCCCCCGGSGTLGGGPWWLPLLPW